LKERGHERSVSFAEGGARRPDGDDVKVADAKAPEDYRVGPRRPPKEFQWKPGQSGNPAGGKRKSSSVAPDLKAVLERALSKKVTLRQGEQERTVSMAAAGIEQLVAQFAKGDRYARRDILDLAHELNVDLLARRNSTAPPAETDVTAEDQALLADFLRRHARRAIASKSRSSSTRTAGAPERGSKKHGHA
jgi:Family of unknown function (DUF5681)